MTWDLIFQHLYIVLASSLLSIALGVPLGIWSYLSPKAKAVILRVVDLLQTIPSLALLGMIMVILDPGKLTVIIGITLYSLLPIVRNTCLGLEEVDPGIREAARGMGMSKPYRVLMVEFPLAFPTVFTGIRIAVVNAIGTAVFAAFVGGGGLGGVITQAIRVADMGLLLKATAVLMVIALGLDLLMEWFEGQMRSSQRASRKMWIPVAAVLLAFCLLLPYGKDPYGDITLYDGDYSETQLLHHMVKMMVEDQTDLSVVLRDQMSQVNNFNSMVGEDATCDAMLTYDGTLLTTFFHEDTTEIPEGSTLFDYVKEKADRDYDLAVLPPLGFDNTYSIGVPEALAEKYGLETISDLVPLAPELTFGAEQDFYTLEGSMKYQPFVTFYHLDFQEHIPVDQGLKYTAIENGSFDVSVVYATDGMNRKANLKILEDDRSFFPDYNGLFLVRQDLLDQHPEVKEILNQLVGQISTEQMAELTYQVDVMGQPVDQVARDFLHTHSLLSQ